MLDNDENIAKLINVNEMKTEYKPSSFIAYVERCQSLKTEEIPKRDLWYQTYSVQETYVKDTGVKHKVEPQYKVGETIASIEAVNDPMLDSDFRPRVFDNITQTWTLLDSGSCVSCTPKEPGDKIDPSFRLRAVNGNTIPTFGTKKVQIRIGRKQYEIEAIKTDIPQQILGWDVFKKYNLGFEWNSGELYLTDKKAQIKSLLKFVKVDSESCKRVESVDYYEEPAFEHDDFQRMLFEKMCMDALDDETFDETTRANQVNAMTIDQNEPSPIAEDIPVSKEIDPEADDCYQANIKALGGLSGPFADLIKEYPEILKANFKKEPTSDIYHRIETTGQPFKSKVRPLLVSSDKSEQGKKLWNEMIKLGVIERVQQNTVLQYTSPLHLARKPNSNSWRVCADFRLLNAQTTSDNYPLPLLRSFQSNIKGAKVFSTIDLKSAFHHLPIHPDDVNKTCVLSPWGGAFVYKRLAFGLSNGPASWQKYVDRVLSGIPDTFCYLDDILVCSENVEGHLSTVRKIFDRLQEHGLTLNLDKCTFAKPTIDYLGYEVSSTGIRPLKRKTDAIGKIPAPTTQKQMLQFLGALNYFRSSLSGLTKEGKYHNAANLLQPLYSAATVPIPAGKFPQIWENSPCLQQAFQDAKQLLVQAAELAHPDPSLPLALMTDASQHSIGSVLMERQRNGKWTPLGYMSRHLPLDKVKWSTCRKELLAAQAGLRYFITEIYGRHCTIFSDHAPLVLAFKNPQGFQLHDPVAQRALVEIGQFTKDVRHIAGLKNVGSDFLSRIPPEATGGACNGSEALTNEVSAIEGRNLIAMSPLVIFEAQNQCQEVERIKAKKHAASLIFQPVKFGEIELLCEMSQSQARPFLPKSLRAFVIKQMHFAHRGVKESVRQIASHYYWTDMKSEITRYVQTCHNCQSNKPSKNRPPHYGHFEVPDQRFTHVHLDVVGPLPQSEGYKYLLTAVDRTTRLFFAWPITEPSAKECSQQFLLHYISLFGIPSACTSDQGSNFVSAMFQELQRNLSIDINHTPVYWPQGNGLLERQHQTLKTSLRAQLLDLGNDYQSQWYHYLPWALLGVRTSYNKDLGTSSSELALGTHVQIPGAILQPVDFDKEPDIKAILEKLEFKNNRVAVPTSKNPQEPVDPPSLDVTHVYARQHKARALQQHYIGPLRIFDRPTRSTVELRVGRNSDDSDRLERRAWADCKPANLREGQADAERPKRGRPAKQSTVPDPTEQVTSDLTDVNKDVGTTDVPQNLSPQPNSNDGGKRSARSTRNPAPNYVDAMVASIDFSKPPPPYPPRKSTTWTASSQELEVINRSIRGY